MSEAELLRVSYNIQQIQAHKKPAAAGETRLPDNKNEFKLLSFCPGRRARSKDAFLLGKGWVNSRLA
jgi:hypothetical protein